MKQHATEIMQHENLGDLSDLIGSTIVDIGYPKNIGYYDNGQFIIDYLKDGVLTYSHE